MADGGKSNAKNTANDSKGKKRKHYLPHNKPVKKKGYPLRPGVQGFFITCDGGRERQASREAINVIDSFYEELTHGIGGEEKSAELSAQPTNKKIKFTYSESSSGEEEDGDESEDNIDEEDGDKVKGVENKANACPSEKDGDHESLKNDTVDEVRSGEHAEGAVIDINTNEKGSVDLARDDVEPPVKKQCLGTDSLKSEVVERKEEKSVDKLIEAELEELSDKNKRRFFSLDTGCNGLVFVQMRNRGQDPGPREIVQHLMTTAASTRKHMSRFILRVLPIEVSCYASEDEISRAIKPLVAQYFPIETDNPQKFAVLYDARANSGIDRMKIINSVAKSIPGPHKVDLSNPDKSIVVQIVKTVCLIGVVEKYKELSKFNLRQLTSPKS
ncbi:hypothetical protein SAY86_008592 [Trapa natans]|uniref:THUMP domain-containing protein n=1 Tax=Trapa natans TaxID=22666 RepID=A0AAN7KD54_TRANT|nr:hypothetical protein SAY86_008592 [Trapa natans]